MTKLKDEEPRELLKENITVEKDRKRTLHTKEKNAEDTIVTSPKLGTRYQVFRIN